MHASAHCARRFWYWSRANVSLILLSSPHLTRAACSQRETPCHCSAQGGTCTRTRNWGRPSPPLQSLYHRRSDRVTQRRDLRGRKIHNSTRLILHIMLNIISPKQL